MINYTIFGPPGSLGTTLDPGRKQTFDINPFLPAQTGALGPKLRGGPVIVIEDTPCIRGWPVR